MAQAPEDRRALYLRWRPLSFADVVGQEHVVRTLRNAVAAGSPAHAYLFAGPRGTGKTSVARIFYRAVNCAEPREGDACGQCSRCRVALEGRSLDLVEIDAASNRGIDDMRELRDKVAFSPSEMRYRVYIVDEAHELTGPAWDAFLKTLEEPPPHAIFVLATTEPHKVPSTIVSRCQRFDFRRIKSDDIAARLVEIAEHEGIELDRQAAERLARMARGGLRDAISLLDQSASFSAGRVDLAALHEVLGISDRAAVRKLLEALGRGEPARALESLVELASGGADLRLFAADLASDLRGLLFAGAGASQVLRSEFSAEDLAWFEAEAGNWQPATLNRLLQSVVDALARIRDGGQFQLYLELAILAAASPEPAALLTQRTASLPGAEQPPRAPGLEAAVSVSEAAARTEPTQRPIADLPAQEEVEVVDSAATPARAEQLGGQPSALAATVALVDAPLDDSPSEAVPLTAKDPASAPINLEDVRRRWPRVVDWVAKHKPLVSSYLEPAELRELSDDCLVLGFAFKVHHERLADPKNRNLVEQACEAVLGQSLRVRCERIALADDGARSDLDLEDPVLSFALDRFGGRAELLGQ